MKRTMKRTVSVFLTALFLLSAFSTGYGPFAADEDYQNGDIIEFGSYPQSQVMDEETLAALNAAEKEWVSYGYYFGTGNYHDANQQCLWNGQMTASDYMQYADIIYGGQKYRGVYFSQYRPSSTGYLSSTENSYQDDNGYFIETTYWFLWEPLQWRILDVDTGLVLCKIIVDSQPFSNYSVGANHAHWGNAAQTFYSNNYEKSDVRYWLTEGSNETSFLNSAFNDSQLGKILSTTLDNSASDASYSQNDSASTTDKLFLLAYNDALNISYGFNQDPQTSDTARLAKGSEYAKCQGLFVYGEGQYRSYSNWRLRTAGRENYNTNFIRFFGDVFANSYDVNSASMGIRPAMRLDLARLAETDAPSHSGSCGENVQWAFDEESGVLALTGSGAMDSLDVFEDYDYSVWQDDIRFVVAADGVTSIGTHAFEGCPVLEEVILGDRVTMIGESAFANCPKLANITTMSNVLSVEDALPKDRTDWTLVAPMLNDQAVSVSREYGVPLVTFSYIGSMLSFNGDIIVHDDLAYSYLPVLVEYYSDAQTVYFERLVFADIPPNTDSGQRFLTEYNGSLAMENVKVSLVYIAPDGHREDVTYARMLELLQSGDYSAFKLRIVVDDTETTEETIAKKLEEIFPFVPKKVLRIVSKAINFIVNIFKKK